MLNVIRSEAIRISQRRTLLIWFGLMAGFAVMVNTVMGSALSASTGGLPTPGVSLPTREELETSSGIVAGLWSASNMFGVVTLSLWAFFTAQDYSSGLIRLLVASEPNRLRLLAGKAITLAGFTALAVTVAVIANIVAAPAASLPRRGGKTSRPSSVRRGSISTSRNWSGACSGLSLPWSPDPQ